MQQTFLSTKCTKQNDYNDTIIYILQLLNLTYINATFILWIYGVLEISEGYYLCTIHDLRRKQKKSKYVD